MARSRTAGLLILKGGEIALEHYGFGRFLASNKVVYFWRCHRASPFLSSGQAYVIGDVILSESKFRGEIMKLAILLGVCATILATFQPAQARITKTKITRVESPTFEGRSFGNVGQYEKLVGRVVGELDPADPHNLVITDIKFAPRNASHQWLRRPAASGAAPTMKTAVLSQIRRFNASGYNSMRGVSPM